MKYLQLEWIYVSSLMVMLVTAGGCDDDINVCDGPIPVRHSEAYPPTLNLEWSFSDNWLLFSSPRQRDLNGDCVADIVVGFGWIDGPPPRFDAPEEEFLEGGVIALDGYTGKELWRVMTHQAIVGTPLFVELDDDGTDDVVVGGRNGALVALSGKSGSVMWSWFPRGGSRAESYWNFYTAQSLGDRNADGVPDILVANGGDSTKEPFESRPPGYIMVISGKTGEVLGKFQTPDDAETYMSPLLYQATIGSREWVLFGTGGETFAGSLWRIALSDLLAGTDSTLELLVEPESYKGVIAPPSLTDLNQDGVVDIVAVTYDSRVVALDGDSGEVLWEFRSQDTEIPASPAIGFFNDDSYPDVLVTMSIGSWPSYGNTLFYVFSGLNGAVIEEGELALSAYASPVAADLNGDGLDEALISLMNFSTMNACTLYMLDFQSDEVVELSSVSRACISTPLIADLDQDGLLELITATWSPKNYEEFDARIERATLNASAERRVSWGAYLGNEGTGMGYSARPAQ